MHSGSLLGLLLPLFDGLLGGLKTWRAAVERQADGVEQRALARTRIARDGEESGRTERLLGEVNDLLAFDGGEVAKRYLFYLHCREK